MHDEPPATRTTEKPIADSAVESTDRRRERDDRPEPADETPATGPSSPRSRDGVDPPDGEATTVPGDDPDRDEDPLVCRLERLRLWRTLATLAVVVARLVRSL